MKKKKLMSVVAAFSLLTTSGLNPGIQFTDRQTYPLLTLTAAADEIVTPAENVVGASLILGGSLKVNIKFDGDISDSDNWTLNGQPFSTINKTTVYAVPAKDFMSDIVIQHGSEEAVTFSVADLLTTYKASENTKDIAEALDYYCQAARAYFSNGTVADYSGSYSAVMSAIGSHPVDMGDGYYASSLLLKSSTILRHYYTEEVPGSTAGQNGYYYIEEAVPAHKYSNFSSYCVNDYIYKALSNPNADANLKNLCVALYNYGNATMVYAMTPGNIDTDGDGLFDEIEVRVNCNPNLKDSDGNGIPDGDEDFDGDGISNLDEIHLGICPYAKDSDYDDINDYDELNVYHTDPFNEDSDGDGIIDGDELILNTDLNNAVTNGAEDNKNTKEYQFSASSEQTEDFNADSQPFKFSFDIKAAGAVDRHVKVEETGYSYAISDNPYIIGKSPCISYDDRMQVDNVSVYFAMQDGYNADISKYTVFYYWEGYNLLIPIETYYDEANKTVYAHNIYAGTYCLVNTDALRSGIGNGGTQNAARPVLKAHATANAANNPEVSVGATTTWNGHDYFLITCSAGMTYNDAVRICAGYGGYPATISSSDENGVVSDVSDWNNVWLGASIEKPTLTEYIIHWISGEDGGFESWGQPYFVAGINETDHISSFWGLWYLQKEGSKLNAVVCECGKGDDPTLDYDGLTFSPYSFVLNGNSNVDTDGDGIPDIQELSSFDRGVFGRNGNYIAALFSLYLRLAGETGIPVDEPTGAYLWNIRVPSFNSHPEKKDSDNDGYSDYEDARPEEKNEDMIIILSWGDNDACKSAANLLKNHYQSCGKKCSILEFNGYNSFVYQWSRIGDFITIDPCGKYFYNVTDVILDSHGYGDGHGICLGNYDYLAPPLSSGNSWTFGGTPHYIEEMATCRRFDKLDMLICNGANTPPEFKQSLAETFIDHFSSIKKVFAFDCNCQLNPYYEGHDVVWEGLVSYDDPATYTIWNAPGIDMYKENYDQLPVRKGQVLYTRYSSTDDSYIIYNSNLYPGGRDVTLYVNIKIHEPGRQDYYGNSIRHISKPSEPNDYGFDPVLRN